MRLLSRGNVPTKKKRDKTNTLPLVLCTSPTAPGRVGRGSCYHIGTELTLLKSEAHQSSWSAASDSSQQRQSRQRAQPMRGKKAHCKNRAKRSTPAGLRTTGNHLHHKHTAPHVPPPLLLRTITAMHALAAAPPPQQGGLQSSKHAPRRPANVQHGKKKPRAPSRTNKRRPMIMLRSTQTEAASRLPNPSRHTANAPPPRSQITRC